MSRLRSKLGEALPELRLIHTHTGIGYRFSPDSVPVRCTRIHILFT